MKYYSCPKCGSMIHESTAGTVCLNSICGWKEFPVQLTVQTGGTSKYLSVDFITTTQIFKSLTNLLLADLIDHHHKVVHTMQIPNGCETCKLINEATEILK